MAKAFNPSLARAPRRQHLLNFLDAEEAAGRPFPTVAQIKAFMGWVHDSSVKDCLHTLAAFDKVVTRTWINKHWVFSYGPPAEPPQRALI